MSYKIINNELALKQYISLLPELKTNEVYYFCLMARNKYSDKLDIKDSLVLARNFAKNKSDIFNKILKMEVPDGVYDYEGQPIPNEMMVLYIKPNPRDLILTNLYTQKELVNEQIKLYRDNQYKTIDPNKLTLNSMQEAYGTKHILDIDFDVKNEKNFTLIFLLELIISHKLLPFVRSIIKTRGGYHVQFDTDSMTETMRKRWVGELLKENKGNEDLKIEIVNDCFLPLTGTTHGGFTPQMMYYSNKGLVLATSLFWSNFSNTKVLDPDGWDRKNYDWSYNHQLISYLVYLNRTFMSTVKMDKIPMSEKIISILGEIGKLNTIKSFFGREDFIKDLQNPTNQNIFNDYISFLKSK